MSDTTLYVQVPGCTTYAANGERGTTTAIDHYGAFVRLAERDAMFYLELGAPATGSCDCTAQDVPNRQHNPLCATQSDRKTHREVVSVREIADRDEFDRIVGIDKMRTEMGWAL